MHALQIVVQGISWKAREEQLRELFAEIGEIESASVVMGRDGRSRVRPVPRRVCCTLFSCGCTQLQLAEGMQSCELVLWQFWSLEEFVSPSDLLVDQVYAGTDVEALVHVSAQSAACTCTYDG